jgi:hypothetical protein
MAYPRRCQALQPIAQKDAMRCLDQLNPPDILDPGPLLFRFGRHAILIPDRFFVSSNKFFSCLKIFASLGFQCKTDHRNRGGITRTWRCVRGGGPTEYQCR